MHDGYDNHRIAALRSPKNAVNPYIPYHFLQEQERGLSGNIELVNTLFLTGKECVYKCLMCDLWKNTLDEAAPLGAITQQIGYALERLPLAHTIKLYNSGNFFDTKAISPQEYPAICHRLTDYKRVVVENHPKLCNNHCLAFNDQLDGQLEVAMGLETIHPEVLPKLNKQLTADDFTKAPAYLTKHAIDVRAFILLNPPYLTQAQDSIEWTLKSDRFAFESGAARCSVIPVRPGNGIMEVLRKEEHYTPPSLAMLEEVMERALLLRQGQVFVDTWDIGFLSSCPGCFEARKDRLEKMNLTQEIIPAILCHCNGSYG